MKHAWVRFCANFAPIPYFLSFLAHVISAIHCRVRSKFLFMNLIKLYISHLKKFPARTKISTGGVIVGTGDILAQQFIEKRKFKEHDWSRTGRLTLVGLCLIAPYNFTWLDKVLPRVTIFAKNSKTKNAICKVLIDQAVSAPIVCTFYIAGNAVTQGKDVEKTVVERVPDTVLKFWCLWAPMQFINFRFVSQTFNMPMVQVLNLIWTTYLSALDNNRKDDELNEFSKSS